MRILFVHDRLGAFGGAEANILACAAALRGRGHEIGLAHGRSTGAGASDWAAAFPKLYPLPPRAGGPAMEAALAAFRPEVIYLHKMADPGVLGALGRTGPSVARMVHDHDLYCMRGYKYGVLSRKICRRPASWQCLFPCGACVGRNRGGAFPLRWVSYPAKRLELDLNRRFARLLVATTYMREELLRNGFSADRIEIHPPVPVPASPTDAPSFGPRNLIVYAGQLIRGKGVDVLVEALARVAAPFECDILGDGPHRTDCERLSRRLGLDGRVRFAGFVGQREIAARHREASVAVMSSLWPEPFGAAGLEAMRHGLPVVAFDAGGIREWLIDGVNGRLVPWMDREAFARAIDGLLRDKAEARRLGDNGRRLAEDRFNFGRYIAGLEDVLARTASPHRID
ncbi:MAG: glycosyltransferase family 4 protein [Opitutaceae bacterium]